MQTAGERMAGSDDERGERERHGSHRRHRRHGHKRRRREGEGEGSEHGRRRHHRKSRSEVEDQANHIARVLEETGRVVGYDDEENPFGDDKLSKAFVWHKKIEKQIEDGSSKHAFSADRVKEKHEERLREIEQVKKRRAERERELAKKQEELDVLQKERILEEAAELEQRDEGFHAEQARTRSEIRLREGRAKPADVFYDVLNDVSTSKASLQDPCGLLEVLEADELADLERELQSHAALDAQDETKTKFWDSALLLCANAIAEKNRAGAHGGKIGVHDTLRSEINDLLRGKSMEDLAALKEDIAHKLREGSTGDEEYWQAVLDKIKLEFASAQVDRWYQAKLRSFGAADGEGEGPEGDLQGDRAARIAMAAPMDKGEGGEAARREYRAREWSPEPEDPEARPGEDASAPPVVTEAEDAAAIRAVRARVVQEERTRLDAAAAAGASGSSRRRPDPQRIVSQVQSRPQPSSSSAAAASASDPMAAYSSRLMGERTENDDVFSQEVKVDKKVEWWHQKYQARKPKYFNRVHTGFDWTKYNQTHYDYDNPPPKVVKGYKFNIFYPDLPPGAKAPSYKIERDGNSADTCIIRFVGGPPYEDVAFKIVNKEWEYSHKHGFKCSFDRGILHLFFNFKRSRYRK